ncbi:MAG: N-acetylmuramoyl-L-alanine amidase, partial [Eggerthellaceae bacterium]|nr:N-acetylmuramoyl-L-alanine amidase [Eggerthellaceae bacterium]
ICIDPGHGGSDPGACGNGLQESWVNLSIALHLREYLSQFSNCRVVMTRDGDWYVDLQKRCDIARDNGANFFISIHNNAACGGVRGVEGIFPNRSAFNHDCNVVGWDVVRKSTIYVSELGLPYRRIYERCSRNGMIYPDGYLQDYYAVIRGCRWYNIPSVIMEHAFIDNAQDAACLADDGWRIRMAEADGKAIAEVFGLKSRPDGFAFEAHSSEIGWQGCKRNGETCGTINLNKPMEAFRATIEGFKGLSGSISYSLNVTGLGWQSPSSDWNLSGTVGQGRTTEGIQLSLTGDVAHFYDIYYRAHISNRGWLGWAVNGQNAGSEDLGEKLEAVQIQLINKGGYAPGTTENRFINGQIGTKTYYTGLGWTTPTAFGNICGSSGSNIEAFRSSINGYCGLNGKITYSAHVSNSGWEDPVSEGDISGDFGTGRSIEALQISISGEVSDQYDLYFRSYVRDLGWLGWAKGGEKSGSVGYSISIEAVQLSLVTKGRPAPGSTEHHFIEDAQVYKSYIEGSGWQMPVPFGVTSGTVGKNKAIKCFSAVANGYEGFVGSIAYSAHVTNEGWQDYVSDGETVGTIESGKIIQAIVIDISGELSENYDIYYRTHVEDYGWLGWAKNGEKAGTTGYNKSMQAIQVDLVRKGSQAPGSTEDHFRNGDIFMKAYVSNVGWQDKTNFGQVCGTTGKNQSMEAFLEKIDGYNDLSGSIKYAAHVSNVGWQSFSLDGAITGTIGQNKSMEAIKIEITGEVSNYYDIYYRAHCSDFGWLGWARNGEEAGSQGYAKKLEALQVQLIKKGDPAPGPTDSHFKILKAWSSAHVSNIGWQPRVEFGNVCGTTSQNLPMEAFNAMVDGYNGISGSISYAAHVSNIGWQGFVADGGIAGTTGSGLSIEAIKINLSGEIANSYDIYYQAYITDHGWLGWAMNGQEAGSQSIAKSMQALKVVMVYKGGAAPGSTDGHFISEESIMSEASIMGATCVAAQRMVDRYNRSGHMYPSDVYLSKGAPTINDFCNLVVRQANAEGVRAEVLFSQAMHETGWLGFGGAVRADQCNFGGIGATDSGGTPATFPDVATGLLAQVQHLKAYACSSPLNTHCVDPRFRFVERDCAPYVLWLGIHENPYGKGWASCVGYGQRIIDIMRSL